MTGAREAKTRTRVALPFAAAALVAVVLAVAGCGGGSSSGSGGGATATGTTTDFIVESNDEVTKGDSTEIVPGHYPNGRDTDEEQASGRKHVKPCKLVSVKKAEAILGANVTRSEHLQGPTCIYTGSGREISLSLQEVSLRTLRAGARKATKVKVGDRTGWCLRYEKTSVAVAIHQHETLVVGGPCQAGVPFAVDALAML